MILRCSRKSATENAFICSSPNGRHLTMTPDELRGRLEMTWARTQCLMPLLQSLGVIAVRPERGKRLRSKGLYLAIIRTSTGFLEQRDVDLVVLEADLSQKFLVKVLDLRQLVKLLLLVGGHT